MNLTKIPKDTFSLDVAHMKKPSTVIYAPKFSDRQVWANSVDRDQTAPKVSSLISVYNGAILSTSFGAFILYGTYKTTLSHDMTKPTK